MLRDEPTGGAGSGVGVRGVPPLQSHLRRTHLCLNQSSSGLLPLLRRDSGVRCIVQRGSHRQLLAEEVIRTEERNRILHFCMGEMNPDYREVLYLTYFEDMSYAQAAEVTGKTVKQITNMVYRGKESLRRLLEREGITNAES